MPNGESAIAVWLLAIQNVSSSRVYSTRRCLRPLLVKARILPIVEMEPALMLKFRCWHLLEKILALSTYFEGIL